MQTNLPKVGETVYAIGTPKGYEKSITRGLVSQLRRRRGTVTIQTDAAISPGSSGGGLFNEKGELIGITTRKIVGDVGEAVKEWTKRVKEERRTPKKQSVWKRLWNWYDELAFWKISVFFISIDVRCSNYIKTKEAARSKKVAQL